jgi:altronate dehydratase
MLDALAEQRREECRLGALAIGLRSSSSSLESARLVNPLVGALVDRVVDAGGAVVFSELADLAGVAGQLARRAVSPEVAADVRAAMAGPCGLLAGLAAEAPDPTSTNMQGGIATIAIKGRGALRRLGGRPIRSVFQFGEVSPGPGLRMMDGPGSAAVCLTGLAAAGCTILVYTVGLTSSTATMPLMPVVRVGPPVLHASRDLDWCAAEEGDVDEFIDLVRAIASGQPTVGEPNEARQIMLPSHLPPL